MPAIAGFTPRSPSSKDKTLAMRKQSPFAFSKPKKPMFTKGIQESGMYNYSENGSVHGKEKTRVLGNLEKGTYEGPEEAAIESASAVRAPRPSSSLSSEPRPTRLSLPRSEARLKNESDLSSS